MPAVEYRTPGFSRASLRASLEAWSDVPVTIILVTPEVFLQSEQLIR